MLLPQKKEREYRFKLALRMGLPIFALIIAFISHTLISSYENLDPSFYVESALLVMVGIYFLFYLIYRGFDVKITDSITQTFSREYLYEFLQKQIKKEKEYTLILISVNNIEDINSLYGMKNGDRVLLKFSQWLSSYLAEKGIENFPLGHIKSGDFIIGLQGKKEQYRTIFDLLCLKLSDFKIEDIEIKVSGAFIDTTFSSNLEFLLDKLFELQEINSNAESEINPNELEHNVIQAIKEKKFSFAFQDVFEGKQSVIKECFVKLKDPNRGLIHQKNYLKVLNKLGLMLDFDLMILEEVLSSYMKNDTQIYALRISPKSLRNQLFYTRVQELLMQNGGLKKRVMFVLSELEYFSYTEKYKNILNSLRDAGVLITIDRLGSLATSFFYLRELDIDCVRFDPFYTKELENKKYRTILEGFNMIAHKNSIKSWIKMVENEKEHKLASDLKIDYIQGKYLASLKEKE